MSPAKTVPLRPVSVHQLSSSGVSDRAIVAWVRAARRRLPHRSGVVSVAVVGSARSRRLNKRYRRRNRATNVLSFHLEDSRRLAATEVIWGELVLCPAVIRREAHDQDRPYRPYLRFLVEHGLIHLLGLDHSTPAEQRRWRRYEQRLA